LLLPHAKLAYNKAPSKTTRMFSLKVVYGIDPLSPLDLVPRVADEKPSVEANQSVEEIGSSTSKS